MTRIGSVAEPDVARDDADHIDAPQVLVAVPAPTEDAAIVDLMGWTAGGLTARYAEWSVEGGEVLLTGEAPFVEVSGRAPFAGDGRLDGTARMQAAVKILGLRVAEASWSVGGWDPATPLALPDVRLTGTRLTIDARPVGSGVTIGVVPGYESRTEGELLAIDLPAGAVEGGVPLEPRIADLLGGLLGADLSALRVHSDAAVAAGAFTVGSDLFFAPGAYDVANPDGAHLLDAAVRQVLSGETGPVAGPVSLTDPGADSVSVEAVPAAAEAPSPEAVTESREPTEPEAAQPPAAEPGAPPVEGPIVEPSPETEGALPLADEVELLMPAAPAAPGPAQTARMGAVTSATGRTAAAAADLPSAQDNVADARGAVTEPAAETAARARAAVAEALGERPAPSPEIVALCERIRTAIRERRPVDEDELTRANPEAAAREAGSSIDTAIQGQAAEVQGSYEGMNNPGAGTPGLTPTPVETPPPTAPGPGVDAATAAPDAIPEGDLSLDADRERVDQQVTESRIERHSTEPIQQEPFTTVREGRAELGEMAETTPAELATQQAEAIARAETDMAALQQQAVAALNTARSGTVGGVSARQTGMVGSEEVTRESVSTRARQIFDAAQTQVNTLLEPLSRTAMARWDTGVQRLSTEFRQSLDRVQRWIDERHSGVGGFFVAGWDALAGLPDWVTDEYDAAERRFGDGVCDLLLSISSDVNGVIAAAQAIVQQARDDIDALFSSLPDELREWAEQERTRFSTMLDGLDQQVRETQTSFVQDVSRRATEAVAEVQAEVERRREAAKGVVGRIADAIQAFIDDPVRAIINGLLTLVGIPPASFWALVARIQQVIADIADDPENFINNLVAGLKQGFQQFFDHFGTHVLNGFWEWLFSGLGSVGVQLPRDFSTGSLVTFALQVMGITWPRIREILVRHVGEENVQIIETVWEIVSTLIERGPDGIFEMIKERLDPATIVQTILEAAVEYLVETLIQQVVIRVIGMLNPAGAVAQAIELIYRILSWIFRNAARIFRLVETVVNGIADVIAGRIGPMANAVERALASLIPPVIDFLAGLLGLGGLPLEIANVIGRLQTMVLAIVEELIVWLVERGRALLRALGLGGEEDGEEEQPGGSGDEELGTTVRFTAAGEGHRLWFQLAGEDATLMVASIPEQVQAKIDGWRTKLNTDQSLSDECKAEAPGLLDQLGPITDLADQEGDQLARQFIEAARSHDDTIEAPSDDALENRQRAIAAILDRLFTLFGERQSDEAYLADIAANLPIHGRRFVQTVHGEWWRLKISKVRVTPPPAGGGPELWSQSALSGSESEAMAVLDRGDTHQALLEYFRQGEDRTRRTASTSTFDSYALRTETPSPPHQVRPQFLERLGTAAAARLRESGLGRVASNDNSQLRSRLEQLAYSAAEGRYGSFTPWPTDDVNPMLRTAVSTLGILGFLEQMVRSRQAAGLTWDQFTQIWEGGGASVSWFKDQFRAVHPRSHEWIPTNWIPQVVEVALAAARPQEQQFRTALGWIRVHNELRSQTNYVLYQVVTTRFLGTETGQLAVETTLDPRGHVARVQRGSRRPATCGYGWFRELPRLASIYIRPIQQLRSAGIRDVPPDAAEGARMGWIVARGARSPVAGAGGFLLPDGQRRRWFPHGRATCRHSARELDQDPERFRRRGIGPEKRRLNMDPTLIDALQRAVGHGPPYSDDELQDVTVMDLAHARTITGIERCVSLEALSLVGCDVGDYAPLASLATIRTVRIECCDLAALDWLEPAQPWILELRANRIVDCQLLAEKPSLQHVDLRGNPLSDESYRLAEAGFGLPFVSVLVDDEETWRLCRELHASSTATYYQEAGDYWLGFTGLGVVQAPEAAHARIAPAELRAALDEETPVLEIYRSRAPGFTPARGPGLHWLEQVSGKTADEILSDPKELAMALGAAGDALADLIRRLVSPDAAIREGAEREAAEFRARVASGETPGVRFRAKLKAVLDDTLDRLREEPNDHDGGNPSPGGS